MIRYSPLLLILLLMSFGKCNPTVKAPSNNTQSLNPGLPPVTSEQGSFRNQFARNSEDGFEVFGDGQRDDAYRRYSNDTTPRSNVPTLVPGGGRPRKSSGENPWRENPITFPVADDTDNSTPVLCKHATACGDGNYRDSLMGKDACQTIYAIRELSQCKRTRADGALRIGFDVNCSCIDVCSTKELRKRPNTLADQVDERIPLDQIFSAEELQNQSPKEAYLKQMGAMDMTEKFNNYAKFDPDSSLPSDITPDQKQKLYRDKVRDVVNGKATTFPGYASLSQAMEKEPILKSFLKEEVLKSMEPTSPLAERWKRSEQKLKLNDDPLQFNQDRIAANLQNKNSLARRKSLIQTNNNKLVGAMPIHIEGEMLKGNDQIGEFEKTCLYRPDQKPTKCESYLKRYTGKTILMPENTQVKNILLEDTPDDLKEAVAKADMEKCWSETNCKEAEKMFGEVERLEGVLSQNLPQMKLKRSPKINPNNEKMETWDECDETSGLTGHFEQENKTSRCFNERLISKDFGNFLNDNLPLCVNTALSTLGRKTAAKIHMTHGGIQAGTESPPESLHQVGRAIEIKDIKVTYPDGRQESFSHLKASKNKGDNNPFYMQLRKCWSKKVKSEQKMCNRNMKNHGSVGHEHTGHQEHLRLSLPYCPSAPSESGKPYHKK